MLEVTTEVPVPTSPPTKSKRLEIIFRTRASKKLKTYYLGVFLKSSKQYTTHQTFTAIPPGHHEESFDKHRKE
jgi:hypothetical protein